VQTLIDIAISDLFPIQCREWAAAKHDIHEMCNLESVVRQDSVLQELSSEEDALLCVLREAIVREVVALFPYVH
jgi:hypothetical protein